MSRARRDTRLLTFVLLAWLAVVPARGASRYDPALRFRTMTTPHFHIHFHQGEERLARRLAIVAEAAHADLALRLQASVGGRTHVVIADQDDLANGYAAAFPYNAIQIVTGPPPASSLIGNTDDWLRLVFVHEYTHILHLDRAESLARCLRLIFGRAPVGFPNAAQPLWQIEGLATFEESQVTGRGRMVAGDFRALLVEPRRGGRFEVLDRANGGLVPWPSGFAPYAFGGFFFRYLESQFGEASIAQLSRTTSRGYYFLPGPAFKKVFHQPLGEVWREYQRAFPVPADGAASDMQRPRRLTFGGFEVTRPRFAPVGMSIAARHGRVASPALLYSVQNADEYPSLMAVPADGTGRPDDVAERYLGESIASDGRGFIFDQLDLSRGVALKSDLYRLDPVSRRVSRLTRDSRLTAPDVSPDGSLLACIRLVDGVRTLTVFRLAAIEKANPGRLPEPEFVLAEPDVQYGSPRWSPDGRRIVAERWKLGGSSELVIIEIATGRAAVLTSATSGRHTSPAWCPDGKTIIFSSDHEAGEFALYAAEIAPGPQTLAGSVTLYRVAQVSGGAMSPDVSPDGRLIAFIGYTTAGYDVFTLPLDRERWTRVAVDAAGEARLTTVPSNQSNDQTPATPATSAYSPVRMLLPRYWMPELSSEGGSLKAGFSTSSADVLGRHALNGSVTWRVSGGSDNVPLGGRPDWSASYVYDRWRTAFFVSGSETTSVVHVASQPDHARGPDAELRELTAEAGVRLSLPTIRRAQLWQAGLAFDRGSLETAGATATRGRNALRLAWAYSGARTYGFSISPEQGVALGVTTELARQERGGNGNAGAFAAEVRAYPRLGGRHAILALRAGAGTSVGDPAARRIYYLGGSDSAGSLIDFGSSGLSMLRGFSSFMFAGYHTCVANVDYRRPLVRLDRGLSWLPIMARVVHGSLFVDAGNVWWRSFSINDTKVSAGGEASIDLVAGYTLPMTLSAGVAWTRDGASSPFEGPTFYFRIGRAF